MRRAGELRFDVQARGEGLRDLMIEALVRAPEDGRLVHLGRAGGRLPAGRWMRATLRFRAPRDSGTVLLHITYDTPEGARLWLDDGSLTDDSAPPFAGWGAAILAREFPRTLLDRL